jgi:hypothetical protein
VDAPRAGPRYGRADRPTGEIVDDIVALAGTGNVYLLAEDGTRWGRISAAFSVLEIDGDDVRIAIVNPTARSRMSGNGTRIAAAWLMDRTGSDSANVRRSAHRGVRRVGDRLNRTWDGRRRRAETVEGHELTGIRRQSARRRPR